MEPTDAMSPTITTPAMTQAGMILGTAAYMSLEQARGIDEDGASDHSYRAVFSALDADKVDQTAGMLAEPPTPQRAAHRPALTSRAPRSPSWRPATPRRNPWRKFDVTDAWLEHSDRVDRRAGPVLYSNGLDRQHELPALQLRGCFREGLEVEVVEQVHPERDDRERVYRYIDADNVAPFLRHIGAEQRDIALPQERDE